MKHLVVPTERASSQSHDPPQSAPRYHHFPENRSGRSIWFWSLGKPMLWGVTRPSFSLTDPLPSPCAGQTQMTDRRNSPMQAGHRNGCTNTQKSIRKQTETIYSGDVIDLCLGRALSSSDSASLHIPPRFRTFCSISATVPPVELVDGLSHLVSG